MFRGLPASTRTTPDASIRQSADPFPQSDRFSAFFAQWVCSLASTPPHVAASPPPNGGNGVTRTTTRRRHADNQLLMLQNPHRSQPHAPRCIQDRHRVNFFALAPTSGRAGRQIPRTGRRNIATMKPTTPLLTPNTGPLKPTTPLRPKNAPKTPIFRHKGDGGFKPTQAQASKGDGGFRPPGHLADRASAHLYARGP